jgi:hypothetical protein
LKQTAMGALLLSAGGIGAMRPGSRISRKGGEHDLDYFSPHEYDILQAAALRLIGPDAGIGSKSRQTDVALRADRFLAMAEPEVQEQFHQLLVVFNAPIFAFLFDLRLSSFLEMTDEDKDLYVRDWMTSSLAFRRTAFQALKRLCMSMYYTDEQAWAAIGYDGLFLPGDRP